MDFLKIVLKYSTLSAIVSIIYLWIIYSFGFFGNYTVSFLNILFLILCLVLAIKETKKINTTWKGLWSFSVGTLIGLMSSLLYGAWYYIYVKILNPNIMFENYNSKKLRLELAVEGLDEKQITAVIKTMSEVISPGLQYLTIIVINTLTAAFLSMLLTILLRPKTLTTE